MPPITDASMTSWTDRDPPHAWQAAAPTKGLTLVDFMFRRATAAFVRATTLARRDSGQALIEYALIISLIAMVAISALQLTGTHIKTLLTSIAGEV
jgi:Flp pilus assembly pilin Flp